MPFIWTTKDGRRLQLSEIDNQHLTNICRLIYRMQNVGRSWRQGDAALVRFEAEMRRRELALPERGGNPPARHYHSPHVQTGLSNVSRRRRRQRRPPKVRKGDVYEPLIEPD